MRISDWSSDVCSSDLERASVELSLQVLVFRRKKSVGYISRYHGEKADSGSREINCLAPEFESHPHLASRILAEDGALKRSIREIGRASCRARVCQNV